VAVRVTGAVAVVVVPAPSRAPLRTPRLLPRLSPLAPLLLALLLPFFAELLAGSLLLLLQGLPVFKEVLDLAAEGGLVLGHGGGIGGVFGGFDLLFQILHLLFGDVLVSPMQPFLEVLLCDGQLGVAEVVIVRQRADRRLGMGR
jgi:hypothetical protein